MRKDKFITLLPIMVLGLFVSSAANATVISAGGGSFVQSFGKGSGTDDTQTYGQSITVPTDNVLDSFSFWLGKTSTTFPAPTNPSLSFMAYVYEWNGTMATGSALYTSGVYTHNAAPDSPFIEYTFNTGGLSLTTGDTYALFLSTSGLTGDGHIQWESATADEYLGGNFIFLNNGEDITKFTTDPWGSGIASDLHFEAVFSGSTTVPEPATLALLSLGLAGLGINRRKRVS